MVKCADFVWIACGITRPTKSSALSLAKLAAKTKMKLTKFKTMALAAALVGSASGQSEVVGYETLSIDAGFNFIGLRLHEKPLATGTFETVTATTAQDVGADFSGVTGGTFILEIEDGSGIIQEITSASISGDTITVADLSGVSNDVGYSIRPSATLSSAFGDAAANVILDSGNGSSAGADQVWLWNGTNFDQYYFDNALLDLGTFLTEETWVNIGTGAAIDGASIDLVYADGIVLISNSGTDITIAGDLKQALLSWD